MLHRPSFASREHIAALELSSSSARGYSRELRHQVKLAKRYTGYADDTKCEEEEEDPKAKSGTTSTDYQYSFISFTGLPLGLT